MDDDLEWMIRLPERLTYLRDLLAREEHLELDFSPESLAGVEGFLTAQYGSRLDVETDEEAEWIVEGAAAYAGEMLLRLAGGHWEDETEPATWVVPPIHADEALTLPPVAPLELVLATADGRPALLRQYAEWAGAVTAYRAANPSWTPVKVPTPLVDPIPPDQSEQQYLADWLATQERSFPAWTDRFGAGVSWDFSRDSLAVLGELVLRVTPTVEAFGDRASRPFLDVAAWYAGEAMLRARGGQWLYRHGDPETTPYAGWPYIRHQAGEGTFGQPYLAMRLIVDRQEPGLLVYQYDVYLA